MITSIIVAISKNNAIGKDNTLLWNIPDDLKHFKEITSGHTIIMGRKTFESIGRPLPNRRNIIITRDASYTHEGTEVVNSLIKALDACKYEDEVFIIGGGEVYKQTLPFADKLYVTHVEKEFDADTFFPEIKSTEWGGISSEEHFENDPPYRFSVYKKK
ncbi:MAG: dihydrofolate reductase [Candidatus Nomurabacteria bacterium]|nr:dihydrofolate reductase [Candidatus Nomurabacteria bacterium]